MKIKNFLITGAAVVFFASTAFTLPAQTTNTPPFSGRIFQRIAEKLNLSDDQKSQIKTILNAEKDTLQPLLSQLHDARKALRAAIQAGEANEAAVRAASAKVAVVEADLAVERMKLSGKISPLLTDEQREQISDFTQRADDFMDSLIARTGSGLP